MPAVGLPLGLSLSVASGEVGQLINGTLVPDDSESVGLVVSGIPRGCPSSMKQGMDLSLKSDKTMGMAVGLEPGDLDSLRSSGGTIPDGALKVWAPWGQIDGTGENLTVTPLSELQLEFQAVAMEAEGSGADRTHCPIRQQLTWHGIQACSDDGRWWRRRG